METPAGNSREPEPGTGRRRGTPKPAVVRGSPDSPRATVLGSLTIPGRPERVAAARAFIARTFSAKQIRADAEAATLLTSEIVTNAILHTRSGVDGGTVTVVVIGVPHGVLVEILDDGSASTPIVKGDLYAAQGHGLFLVQQLAAQWGYLRDSAGTTVWFHLATADEPQQAAAEQAGPQDNRGASAPSGRPGDRPPDTEPYRTPADPLSPLWAAAQSATARA
jgi:anti-sigma regulatory factor (Ser/Thr protein kinase)